MGNIFNLATGMLWLVALLIVVRNYTGFTSAIETTANSWFAGLKVLQGRA